MCNWVVILSVCITVLCVFDPTGRTFVKLRATKRRQRNLRTYNLRSVSRVGSQAGCRTLLMVGGNRFLLAMGLPSYTSASWSRASVSLSLKWACYQLLPGDVSVRLQGDAA